MGIYTTGEARIKHKETGIVYNINRDELSWECVNGDKRSMGPEYEYCAELEHDDLGQISWTLYEYPVGAENSRDHDMNGHELIDDFDYGLQHSPDFDDWSDYELPEDPYDIFISSYDDSKEILSQYGDNSGDHLINRMVFSQQITALEAYLCDTLTKAVLENKEALKKLLEDDKGLKKQKFHLKEIYEEHDLVSKKVREYLRNVLYHNLTKVDSLYNYALDIKILDFDVDKSSLFQAIKYRHDCVHRNGFDKDGEKLNEFTKQYVQSIADEIKKLVENIEENLKNYALNNCVNTFKKNLDNNLL